VCVPSVERGVWRGNGFEVRPRPYPLLSGARSCRDRACSVRISPRAEKVCVGTALDADGSGNPSGGGDVTAFLHVRRSDLFCWKE